jgi:hypothetical protein
VAHLLTEALQLPGGASRAIPLHILLDRVKFNGPSVDSWPRASVPPQSMEMWLFVGLLFSPWIRGNGEPKTTHTPSNTRPWEGQFLKRTRERKKRLKQTSPTVERSTSASKPPLRHVANHRSDGRPFASWHLLASISKY